MPIICSNRNLLRRDANGQYRKTYLFITPRISNKYNTTIYSHSANSISRLENCSKITRQTIRDLLFHRLECGIFYPSGSDYSALRLEESRRLASLSSNRYLSDSDIFKSKLDKIKMRTDRYLRAYPTPSQVDVNRIHMYVYTYEYIHVYMFIYFLFYHSHRCSNTPNGFINKSERAIGTKKHFFPRYSILPKFGI